MLQKYTYKVIISGDVSEIYAYHRPQYKRIDEDSDKIHEYNFEDKIDNGSFDPQEKVLEYENGNKNHPRFQGNINRTKL